MYKPTTHILSYTKHVFYSEAVRGQ